MAPRSGGKRRFAGPSGLPSAGRNGIAQRIAQPKAYRMSFIAPLPTERSVQRSILAMAGTCFRDVLIFHIPNGAHLAGNDVARFKQMGTLKGDGFKPGVPDLLCLWNPGEGCFIEVKRPKLGRLSPAQQTIHDKLHDRHWPVATVTSQEEAFTFLKSCGAPCSGALQ